MSNQQAINSPSRHYIWSATPTPFLENLELDDRSLAMLVEQHLGFGCDGLFLGGTCGEGPWMTDAQRSDLVERVVAVADGQLRLAAQATENSAARTIKMIELLASRGLEIAVVAQPAVYMNVTPERVLAYYLEILEKSPLPVCFYHRGSKKEFPLEVSVLSEIYSHPKLVMIKDSSLDADHAAAALKARVVNPRLLLLNGDEFSCVRYLALGYDGFMTGGAIIAAGWLRRISEACLAGDQADAVALDEKMRSTLLEVYGGQSLSCWLTGLKYLMVRLGIFSTSASYLGYPLTDECRKSIDDIVAQDRDLLVPPLRSTPCKRREDSDVALLGC